MKPLISAVVLAAGKSERMGRPKMVLPWGDGTVISQVIKTLIQAGVPEILVVTGGARQQVQATLQGQPVRVVDNPDYAEGEMLSTCQVGLSSLREPVQAALIVLGDQPQIEPKVVQSVMEAFWEQGALLVVPSYKMRRGHPWLVDRSLWPIILALKPPATLRDFLNEFSSHIHYVDWEDNSVLQDLDTPEDYRCLRPQDTAYS